MMLELNLGSCCLVSVNTKCCLNSALSVWVHPDRVNTVNTTCTSSKFVVQQPFSHCFSPCVEFITCCVYWEVLVLWWSRQKGHSPGWHTLLSHWLQTPVTGFVWLKDKVKGWSVCGCVGVFTEGGCWVEGSGRLEEEGEQDWRLWYIED